MIQNKQRQEKMDKGIYLSSFHSSKGLEWDHVIIKSANQGITPLKKSEDIEEERRLFYVAMTRAKEQIIILFTHKDGVAQSQFISEYTLFNNTDVLEN